VAVQEDTDDLHDRSLNASSARVLTNRMLEYPAAEAAIKTED
jgi:hypothetical protein